MNEKIRELAIKSWLVSEHKGKLLSCHREDADLTKYLEDFTELIVKECLDQCYNRGMNDELYAGQLKAAAYIKEHFGVEE